ncbi:MAG: hypothetical protein NVS3B10_21780 [Polyangiales bacterium]
MVQTIQANAFQTRGLLLALRSSEPGRLARALAFEAIFQSMAGRRGQARASRLMREARSLAGSAAPPELRTQIEAASGMIHFYLGRWRSAYDDLEVAQGISAGTQLTWERNSCTVFSLSALGFLGSLSERARQFPAALRDADDRGDLYCATNLRVGECNGTWLVKDQPHEARAVIVAAMERWSRRAFHVQHWYELQSLVAIDLYEGNGLAALARLEEQLVPLRRSLLLRLQRIRSLVHYQHGAGALAAASVLRGQDAETMLQRAVAAGRRLQREDGDWMSGLGALIHAGVSHRRGEPAIAVSTLERAIEQLRAADMKLYAAAARSRLGALLGGDGGRAMREEARSAFVAEGVVDPERFIAMMAPGFDGPVR